MSDDPAFDEAGRPVAVTHPFYESPTDVAISDDDAARVRQETLVRLLQWLTSGNADTAKTGRRCLVLAFTLHLQNSPGTLSELAAQLGISKTRAHQLVSELNAESSVFSGNLAENDGAD